MRNIIVAGILGMSLGVANTAKAATLNVIYSFEGGANGSVPYGGLVKVGSWFYGTAEHGGGGTCQGGCGTVFRIKADGHFETIYRFTGGNDGSFPNSGLTYLDGTLYGAANGGGDNNYGALFSVTTTGTLTVLHAFNGSDGEYPSDRLIAVNGTFYGTTQSGGMYDAGIAYSLTPGGVFSLLYTFGALTGDAELPAGGLAAAGNLLFGASTDGGQHKRGTVYSLSLGGNEAVLHSFKSDETGNSPTSNLTKLGGGLFGLTTYAKGCTRCAALYRITPEGNFKSVHEFSGSDGPSPYGELVTAHGSIYGTLPEGGGGVGSVFSYNTKSGYNLLASFPTDGSYGSGPNGEVAYDRGTLFGTADGGGPQKDGVIFSLTP